MTPEARRDRDLALVARARDGDRRAVAELVALYDPLVWKCARRLHSRLATTEDLAQEGRVGLLRAVESFDPARGGQFMSYAHYWVRCLQMRALFSGTLSSGGRAAFWKAPPAARALFASGVESPTDEQVAAAVGLPVAAVASAAASRASPSGLFERDGSPREFVDPTASAEDRLSREQDHRRARAAVDRLDTRRRDVLLRRAEGETLREIGESWGVSREWVRQLEVSAIEACREIVEAS